MDCSICLTELDRFTQRLDCGHEFHNDCINLWLIKNNTCPMCRENIIETHPQDLIEIWKSVERTSNFIGITLMSMFLLFSWLSGGFSHDVTI
jgi:hypothetical protein